MDTSEHGQTRRRRRSHSAEFKAKLVAVCRQPGMSMAAVALEYGLNANLLRRWVVDDERARVASLSEPKPAAQVPSISGNDGFIAMELSRPGAVTSPGIVIELRRGAMLVKVSWPAEAAAACGSWLRELLR